MHRVSSGVREHGQQQFLRPLRNHPQYIHLHLGPFAGVHVKLSDSIIETSWDDTTFRKEKPSLIRLY